jgi:uncharacterized protein (DUF362 family)
MNNRIDRRKFMKQGLAVGVTVTVGSSSFSSVLTGQSSNPKIDLSVVNGTDYFANTLKAVEGLGGMSAFVRRGSSVGLLINSPWNKRGTYTNPDIALAVLHLCLDAGAKEIYSIEDASTSYWKRSNLYKKFEKDVAGIRSDNSKAVMKAAKGKLLKEATISKMLLECDVYINIPIVKNHEGTQFTGNLKNTMGACAGSTNRYFHKGSGKGGPFSYYADVEFLSQCIADVNSIRKPDLCIADATEFVTTNGPSGPGEIKKAQKVVAGVNCVSVDAYCATVLGVKPDDVLMIRYANEIGLGEKDVGKLAVKEM